MNDIKEEILADAIHVCIKNEKTIAKLKAIIAILSAVIIAGIIAYVRK